MINWDEQFRKESSFGGEVLPDKITKLTVDQAADWLLTYDSSLTKDVALALLDKYSLIVHF